MFKKLLSLKNIIRTKEELKILNNLIKESAEMGTFKSDDGAEIPQILVNSLSFRIKKLLPKILEQYYPYASIEKINDYVNREHASIVYQEIDASYLPEEMESVKILDLFVLRFGDISIYDAEINEDEEIINKIHFTDVDSSDPGVLNQPTEAELSAWRKDRDDRIAESEREKSERIANDIVTDLLHEFVNQKRPLKDEEFVDDY